MLRLLLAMLFCTRNIAGASCATMMTGVAPAAEYSSSTPKFTPEDQPSTSCSAHDDAMDNNQPNLDNNPGAEPAIMLDAGTATLLAGGSLGMLLLIRTIMKKIHDAETTAATLIQSAYRRCLACRFARSLLQAKLAIHAATSMLASRAASTIQRAALKYIIRQRATLLSPHVNNSDMTPPTPPQQRKVSRPTTASEFDDVAAEQQAQRRAPTKRAREAKARAGGDAQKEDEAELSARHGLTPWTARLAAALFPMMQPTPEFTSGQIDSLKKSLALRMSNIEVHLKGPMASSLCNATKLALFEVSGSPAFGSAGDLGGGDPPAPTPHATALARAVCALLKAWA